MAIKVMIDPGHAEYTPGKRAANYYEYSSNRKVAKKLKKKLEAHGFIVAFSVDLDNPVDLSLAARAAAAVRWGADLFISIHSNAHSDPNVTGTETFVHSNSTASVSIATQIQKALVSSLGTKNRGTKKANFGVLRGTYQHMFAVLTEGEFFTNPKQRDWMLTDDYDNKYSDGAAEGTCEYYGVRFNAAAKPKPDTSKPIKNNSSNDMVVVEVGSLYTYNSKNWNDKGPIVNKDESFTVLATHTVSGAKMYELQSGLFITANEDYVTLLKGAEQVVPVSSSKYPMAVKDRLGEVEIKIDINYRESASLDSKVIRVLKAGHKCHYYEVKGDWLRLGTGWISNPNNKYAAITKVYADEKPEKPTEALKPIYRVFINGEKVNAYSEFDNVLREAREGLASGSKEIRIEKV